MRISHQQQIDAAVKYLNKSKDGITKVQTQVSSGQRILQPDDDPRGTDQALNLRNYLSKVGSSLSNLTATQGWTDTTESSLTGINQIVDQARIKATAALNDTESADDRTQAASEVAALFSTVVDDANQQYNDQYVLSGYQVKTKPFVANSSDLTFTYNGDSGSIQRELEPGNNVTVNVTGEPVVGDVLRALKSLHDALASNDTDLMRTATDALDAAGNQVLNQITKTGALASQTDHIQSRLETLQTSVQTQLSAVADTDDAEAAVQLNSLQQSYSATMTMIAKDNFKSLFDYLS